MALSAGVRLRDNFACGVGLHWETCGGGNRNEEKVKELWDLDRLERVFLRRRRRVAC